MAGGDVSTGAMHSMEPTITVHGTPNPNAAKFVVDRVIASEGRTWFDAVEAADDPLAASLFRVDGVRALFMVENFITVTKQEDVEWEDIVDDVTRAIRSALAD